MNKGQNENQSLNEDNKENNVKKEWAKPELQLINIKNDTLNGQLGGNDASFLS